MLIALMFVALFAMIVLGVPIAVALAGSSLLYIFLSGIAPEITVIHRMVNGVDSFPLLAVPFFIMAGNLMNSAGITKQIFDFATAAVGWLKGGLGHVNVAGSVIFAGMSGTAVADAGGLGTIEIKAMRDHGYDAKLAVGITAASSTIGPIIPPSLPLVIYGVVANASINALFVAGILPGLLMALFLSATVAIYAHRKKIGADARFSVKRLGVTFVDAFLPLLTPAIIIGGMSFGIFTPTEAAVFACAYALLLSVVIHRVLNLAMAAFGRPAKYSVLSLRQFVRVTMDTIETTAVVLFIVAGASIFGWVLTTTRTTEALGAWILAVASDPVTFLLLVNVFLLVVGCFMETIAAITILTPVLLPVALTLGIDPVHFGIIMVLNLMIGLLTPPVGMVLYVLSRVASISFEDCVKAVAPFLIPLFLVLALITFVPATTTWLPEVLKAHGYL
ncbi:TRAP transporter large permease [Chelatococcus daeguensis]|uniref:TRAP transporter large permease protein n=2 Tax=Chelatococcus TaxID=28209 RepID=A0AAC9JNM9_9HYPH|nr:MULTISPECIES: TRAP transporter large permease [Chelatococcus]APF36115.1 ABC transporter permease [Chelatococcus daeguensis]KZE34754.1 ABC transporter permease [Chelatococcus daeguensis]MBM3082605.1 TRAP transporter large permease [Chelatococcus daeguensis]CUA88805.1 TRAP transporter, DctM subunit [Chelatococcus sambhunathii]